MARLLEHGRGIRRRLLVEVLASEPDWMRHATLAVELLLASSSLSHSLLVVEQREVVGLLDGMRGGRARHPAQHRRRLLALRSSQQVVVGGSELLLLRLLVEEAGEAAACVVLRHDSAELVGIGVLLRKEEEGLRDVDILVDVDVLHVLVGYVGLDLGAWFNIHSASPLVSIRAIWSSPFSRIQVSGHRAEQNSLLCVIMTQPPSKTSMALDRAPRDSRSK